MPTTILIAVEVNEAEELNAPGLFRTTITHPELEGSLSFIHGSNNRNVTLSSIKESFLGDVSEIVSLIGDLTNGKGIGKATIPSTS